jgi:hypothetical protein
MLAVWAATLADTGEQIAMSEEEKAVSVGRLMLQWKSSNEKMGAFEAEFLRHSETMKLMSSLLARSRRVNADQSVLGSQDMDECLRKLPTPERLLRLVADAREELARFNELSAQKKNLGL